MALVVPFSPIPGVSPDVSQPGAGGQSLSASSAAFGGQIGAAGEKIGAEVSRAGDVSSKIANRNQQLQNETSVYDVYTSDVSPKYRNVLFDPVSGFYAKQGKDAVAAVDSTTQQLQDIRKEARDKLANPVAQKMFDTLSTRRLELELDGVARHASQQNEAYQKATSDAFVKDQVLDAGANWNNPYRFDLALHSAQTEARAFGEKIGQPPEEIENRSRTIEADMQASRIRATMPYDPKGAMALLEEHGDKLAPTQRAQFYEHLKPVVNEMAAKDIGDRYLRGGGTPIGLPPSKPPSLDELTTAISTQESGGRTDAPTSVNGAVGKFQITPATFSQYARPGESVTDPAANERVGKRIIADLSERYAGDPARVAVGYFSGPGNVAPLGYETPYLRDAADGNGKRTSDYVREVVARMPGRAQVMVDKAAVLTQLDTDPDLRANPQLQDKARSYVTQQFAIANSLALASDKAEKDAQEKAGNGYVSAILKAQNPNDLAGMQRRIADDQALTSAQKENISAFLEKHMKGDAEGDTKHYGPGIWNALQKINLPEGDPERITRADQIWKLGGLPGEDQSGLTVAGVDHALKTLGATQKSTDAAGEQAVIHAALAGVKQKLSFQDEYGFLKDPKGMDAFNSRFMPAFYGEYEKQRAAGKTPWQLLSKDSPDYIVDKLVGAYKRPDAEYAKDRIAAGDTSVKSVPATPDTSTPEGLRAAVARGLVSREDGIKIGIEKGWIAPAGQPAPVAPAVPLR